MKIHLVGDDFFRADGHTCMTKQIVAFRSFANASKMKVKKCGLLYNLIHVFCGILQVFQFFTLVK